MIRANQIAGRIVVRVDTVIDKVLLAKSEPRKIRGVWQSGQQQRLINRHERDLEDKNSIRKLLHQVRRVFGLHRDKVIGVHAQ